MPRSERCLHGGAYVAGVGRIAFKHQKHVNKVSRACVCSIRPWECVSVELFRELLGLGNRKGLGRSNPGEFQKIVTCQLFGSAVNGVSYAYIDVKATKYSAGQPRFDRKSRATLRRALKLGLWRSDEKLKVVPQFGVRCGLQLIANAIHPFLLMTRSLRCGNAEIDVLRCSGVRSIAKLHRISALEQPGCVGTGEESGKETLDGQFESERIEWNATCIGGGFEPLFKSLSERGGGLEGLGHSSTNGQALPRARAVLLPGGL